MSLEARISRLEKEIIRLQMLYGRVVPKKKVRSEKKSEIRKAMLKIK